MDSEVKYKKKCTGIQENGEVSRDDKDGIKKDERNINYTKKEGTSKNRKFIKILK